jgi:hypothetical protein
VSLCLAFQKTRGSKPRALPFPEAVEGSRANLLVSLPVQIEMRRLVGNWIAYPGASHFY